MAITHFKKLSLFSVLLLTLPSFSYAANPVGQMVWVKGGVHASGEAGSRVLSRRSTVYEHDSITTDAGGSGEIVFSDTSLLTLRVGTAFSIDSYKFSKGNHSDDHSTLSVAKGGFRTITGLISKSNPSGYQVNTPVATIGVRGTEYDVYCGSNLQDVNSNGQNGCAFALESGSIYVANSACQRDLDSSHRYAVAFSPSECPELVSHRPAAFNYLVPIVKPPSGQSKVVSSFCLSENNKNDPQCKIG